MVDRYKELVPTPRNGYVRMGVRSHAKGTFLTEVEPGQQIEEQELSKVKADNLVVNIVFAWEHAVAITSADDAKALVSHRFPQFSFHDDMEPGFFRYAILDEAFRWHLWLASPSGAGRNKTLNVGTMLEYEFSVPKKAEQAKIAAFFDRLDDLITLHQCTCPIFYFCAHDSRANFASTPQGQLRVLRYPRPIPKMLVSPSSPVSGVFDITEGARGCGSSSAIVSTGSPRARKSPITSSILCCRDSLSSP